MISLKSVVILCAVASTICISSASSLPALARVRTHDELPNLDDTLAVAKSPFEPVTLALSLPGARNDDFPTTVIPLETIKLESTEHPHKQPTTRGTEINGEQEKDTSLTSIITDSIGSDSSPATSSVTTELSTSEASTSTSESPPVTENFTSESESEAPTTTTRPELERKPATESTVPPPTTTTTSAPELTTISELPSSTEGVQGEERAPMVTSSGGLVEDSTPDTLKQTSSGSSNSVDVTEKPIIDSVPIETEAPTSSTSSPKEPAPIAEVELNTTPSTTTTTTEQSAPETEQSSTAAPTTTTTTTTAAPTTTSTTTIAPTTTAPPTTTPLPTTTTTTTTTTTAIAPEKSDDKKVGEEKENKTSCDHLPTYEAEEIQKVFREETTYKNGTIKGKFTYINFDQRYRLVHYTRLPYGPVKIDLVEELGKPEQSGNRTPVSGTNEVPNAVLQLRNILPNSLFGFPFLGPNSANTNRSPTGHKPEGGEDGDRSNMYFYSTDQISTPNLLTPNVPVSLLPGQRKLSQPINAPDTLDQSYYSNLSVASAQQHSSQNKPIQQEKVADANTVGSDFGGPNHSQFQYTVTSSHGASSPETKQPALMYTYLSQAQPQPQYQYSPLPLYSFHQPTYYSARPPFASQTSYGNKLKQDQTHAETSFFSHQAHQPHGHEHYVAPFMFTHPPSSHGDLPEASKLRLKVKTSKALNVSQEPAGKFAQLRVTSSQGSSYLAPVNSPAQIHRQHRQRVGKQNNDLKTTVNTSPIVYHVLRSPVGRMYTLPQYHQAHAMAYDHDV